MLCRTAPSAGCAWRHRYDALISAPPADRVVICTDLPKIIETPHTRHPAEAAGARKSGRSAASVPRQTATHILFSGRSREKTMTAQPITDIRPIVDMEIRHERRR